MDAGRASIAMAARRGSELLCGACRDEERLLHERDEARAEVERLRSALEEITKWAEAARGHYGIEECSGPGQPRTEWDEVQDGLRAAVLFAREALSGPAPNEDRG
jgi:hypothetical protein